MEEIARDNGMSFLDGTEFTVKSLKAVVPSASRQREIPEHPLILRVEKRSGPSLGALNFSLPSDQVMIGFNYDGYDFNGKRLGRARLFSDAVVARLSQRWNVTDGPLDQPIPSREAICGPAGSAAGADLERRSASVQGAEQNLNA